MAKFLIIRFSSIGDIIQCMNVVNGIKNHFPDAEIHWVARKDMGSFLNMDKRIDRVWGFDKKAGVKGLLRMAKELKAEKFDYIYDAHSNIRSNILKAVLLPPFYSLFPRGPHYTLRSKERGIVSCFSNSGLTNSTNLSGELSPTGNLWQNGESRILNRIIPTGISRKNSKNVLPEPSHQKQSPSCHRQTGK